MEFPNIWAEIDLGAIDHNVRELRRITRPGARFMAVVKADGYGHGAAPVARTALAAGADMLAVARIDEGIALRRDGFEVPILVLNPTFPPFAIHMIQVGEESGNLEGMLVQVADIFDKEVSVSVKRALALLEPILILTLGLLIAGIVMSILVAILGVNQLVF